MAKPNSSDKRQKFSSVLIIRGMLQQTIDLGTQKLEEIAVQPAFSFYQAAKDLIADPVEVSEFSSSLNTHLQECIVSLSKLTGVNRESSQSLYFKMVFSGLPNVTAISGDHCLTMWLSLQIFEHLLDTSMTNKKSTTVPVAPITTEETDIAHYIGGFVIKKLKQHTKHNDEKDVLACFVSDAEPENDTLLAAKSWGKLTNITHEARCMFVEFEQVFRDTFPLSTDTMDVTKYHAACLTNEVIQQCYYSSTYNIDQNNSKEIDLCYHKSLPCTSRSEYITNAKQ